MVTLLIPPPVITIALGKFSHEPFICALKCLMSASSSDPGEGRGISGAEMARALFAFMGCLGKWIPAFLKSAAETSAKMRSLGAFNGVYAVNFPRGGLDSLTLSSLPFSLPLREFHTLFDLYLDGRFVETLEIGPEGLRFALNDGFECRFCFWMTPRRCEVGQEAGAEIRPGIDGSRRQTLIPSHSAFPQGRGKELALDRASYISVLEESL
ncbi:unnamed protein product [Trifolium pratense]|uniref:Uncharacterized protein n=1 Tax=Trifolium pratense TaxID=57577 RepID=A0ACB0KWQ4_TRIPR|nr:unnamed protein product [Trifolium pratense]